MNFSTYLPPILDSQNNMSYEKSYSLKYGHSKKKMKHYVSVPQMLS